MNMKRLVATALAAAMIFGLVSVGFAASATLPDLDGHEFEDEIRTLAGLGVITGYTDGEFKPDNTLTRAEFTALIVRMLGLSKMAEGMQGETVPFSDVDGSHWASGNILIAEALGIVNGYPDGSFKPEASVNHAEAVKMVLTSMGYKEEGFPVVRWPVTWMVKANEIGLDDDVELLGTLPITRGDVAKVLHNSLAKGHVKISDGEFTDPKKSDTTFLSKLKVDHGVGQIVDSPELWSNTSGKIEIDWQDDEEIHKPTSTTKFKVENYEGLIGHWVEMWLDGDNVVHIEKLSTEKSLTWKEYKKDFVGEGKSQPEPRFVNYQADGDEIKAEFEDIVVIYKGSKAIAVKALDYEVGTVEETYAYKDSRKDIYFATVEGKETPETLKLADADVEYFGVDGFEDIKTNDIIHFITHVDEKENIVDKAVVIVMKDVYEGRVTEIISGKEWKVDGKVFEVDEDALDAIDAADDLLGEKVVLYLDKDGKVWRVTHVEGLGLDGDYGVVTKTVRRWKDRQDITLYATILTEDGEVEYEVTKVDGEASDPSVAPDSIVKIMDGAEGTVELTVLESVYKDGDPEVASPIVVLSVDTRARTITFEAKHTLQGVEDTHLEDLDYDKIVWLEGKDGDYQVRPKPGRGDEVVLYWDAKVVVGIVQ